MEEQGAIDVARTLNIMYVLEEEKEVLNFTAPLLHISFVDKKYLQWDFRAFSWYSCDFIVSQELLYVTWNSFEKRFCEMLQNATKTFITEALCY